jgi:DNA-binding Lrp family transcriptional regulator
MLSKKLDLDSIDQKIISLIQENPNLTHTQIAEKIDRSQPTVGMRIKKLEENGILKFQPGINFKNVQLTLATVELKTKDLDTIKFEILKV